MGFHGNGERFNSPNSKPKIISTLEENVGYIQEKAPELHIQEMLEKEHAATCSNLIHRIRNFHRIDPSQKEEFHQIYRKLQDYAKEDALAECQHDLMDLIDEVKSTPDGYTFDVLRPLSKLIMLLMEHSADDYTSIDLERQLESINRLSITMLTTLKGTNEKEAFVCWMNIMIQSASRKPKLVSLSLEKAIEILQSESFEIVTSKQQRQLRRLAKQFIKGFISQNDESVVNNLLETTGGKSPLTRFLYPYIEDFYEDMEQGLISSRDFLLENSISPVFILSILIFIFFKNREKIIRTLSSKYSGSNDLDLSEEKIREIHQLLENGIGNDEIARRLEINIEILNRYLANRVQ